MNSDYWHGWVNGKQRKENQEIDDKKYECYRENGLPCIIIWEHEIKNFSKEELKNRILQGVLDAKRNFRNS